MIIGTVRPEEARVADSEAGYHAFGDEGAAYGSFEVFWFEREHDVEASSGWYWWPCWPGRMPDGEPSGPFASSIQARADANPAWLG